MKNIPFKRITGTVEAVMPLLVSSTDKPLYGQKNVYFRYSEQGDLCVENFQSTVNFNMRSLTLQCLAGDSHDCEPPQRRERD